jgi:ATP-dependent DNA helicase RecQ
MTIEKKAIEHLKSVFGKEAQFREGQLEAIKVALQGKRALIVQRTGWGKSIIYFLSTKILRQDGKGITIIISPLLALMNNQISLAEKFNLKARVINSTNKNEWDSIEKEIKSNSIDILFISPERLSNPKFTKDILAFISASIGMFVIDEAHCISDWGHDFRPDYKRVKNILKFLPSNVPLLATTATANDRVIEDIKSQLGSTLLIQRGSLIRESISIQTVHLKKKESRLAWLSENIPSIKGTGIIYCLTKMDCELVNDWLNENGISSYVYYSGLNKEVRSDLEEKFMENKLKVLVSTTALGMGIDKPDIKFVIHFQKPGNVVAYYQQIGRAGRNLKKAYAVLLSGQEDNKITEYFINEGFPKYDEMYSVINLLSNNDELKLGQIMRSLNINKGRLKNCLKFLEVEGDIACDEGKYSKTPRLWQPDIEQIEKVTQLRKKELNRMDDFLLTDKCFMKYVANELNDETFATCGRCSNCLGKPIFPNVVEDRTVEKVRKFIKDTFYYIEPRKNWPNTVRVNEKNKIDEAYRCEKGYILSNYADMAYGKIVRDDKYKHGFFSDKLIEASFDLLKDKIKENEIKWVTAVPSLR